MSVKNNPRLVKIKREDYDLISEFVLTRMGPDYVEWMLSKLKDMDDFIYNARSLKLELCHAGDDKGWDKCKVILEIDE